MNEKPPNGAKRSGSQKRQRARAVSVAVTAEEGAAIAVKARRSGQSQAAYLRSCALGSAGPRARHSPPVNAELFALAIAQLNRAGNNINQVARALNTAGATLAADEAFSALAETREAVAGILEMVGRKARP